MTGGRRDVAEADVEAVREEERGVVLQVRLDLLGVDGALVLVRREDHHHVRLLHGVRNSGDLQALLLGTCPGGRANAETDGHVNAGVAQVQRVGVALGAVADDGDLLGLDECEIGIVVVEHFSHGWAFLSDL